MRTYSELRQELSERIYPFLIDCVQEEGLDALDAGGDLYNPDGSKLGPQDSMGSMVQTFALYFPGTNKRLVVVIGPSGAEEASVSIFLRNDAVRHIILVNEEGFEVAWTAIQSTLRDVVGQI